MFPLFTSTLLTLVLQITCLPLENILPFQKQYGVILDAGSSSTKVRIYTWDDTSAVRKVPLFNEEFYHKVKPGISAFKDDVTEITTYIEAIIELLKANVPPTLWPITPVYFMATAGMRLLDENTTKSIIMAVESSMSNKEVNPFLYDDNFVQILAGEEEALFAWLTINYLNKFFFAESQISESYGLVELGGGSAQIAFIPEDPIYAGKMPVIVAGHEFAVYCHSHLSYGATLMADRISEYLIRENPHANVVVNPCMLKGDKTNGSLGEKTIGMLGGGNASLCEGLLRHYLTSASNEMCSPKPCSIGQVYQPSIKDRKFFTFGLIYYIAKDLGVLSEPGVLDLAELQRTARTYCSKTLTEAVEDFGMSPKWASRNCEDGLYIPLLFSTLGFDLNSASVVAGKDIGGESIAWSLGGMLYEEERNLYQEIDNVVNSEDSTILQ